MAKNNYAFDITLENIYFVPPCTYKKEGKQVSGKILFRIKRGTVNPHLLAVLIFSESVKFLYLASLYFSRNQMILANVNQYS